MSRGMSKEIIDDANIIDAAAAYLCFICADLWLKDSAAGGRATRLVA